MKAREDAQLAGIIPTVPEGTVREEVAPVAPDPPLPHLVRAAIKNTWATPDSAKPKVDGRWVGKYLLDDPPTGDADSERRQRLEELLQPVRERLSQGQAAAATSREARR